MKPASQPLGSLYNELCALHRADDIRPLWRSLLALLRAAVPSHRVTLFLGHIGMGEARMVFTDPPIADAEAWFAARSKDSPFNDYILAHRRRKHYRFSDVLPPAAEFAKTPFARRVARREGWDKGLSVLFWEKTDVKAMFSLYRSRRQRDFTDREVELLLALHPFVETALDRVARLHGERQLRRGLEEFNKRIPIGLILLDWDLRALFANEEAQKRCVLWHHGEAGSRSFNVREAFALPDDLLDACAQVKDRFIVESMRGSPEADSVQSAVDHASIGGLRATVSMVGRSARSIARPRLLVLIEHGRDHAARERASERRVALLAKLTPSEKEIAEQICRGLSNQEIADALSKSVLTVKTQITSIFQKLGVANRSRLIAALR